MVSLVDLAPSTRSVRVGGEGGPEIAVFGVSIKGLAHLLAKYPALRTMFTGGGLKFDLPTIQETAPDAIAEIIAAGCDSPGDSKAIEAASRLPIGDQAALLSAIVELTMPDGIGPFMVALESVLARLDLADRGKAPATK